MSFLQLKQRDILSLRTEYYLEGNNTNSKSLASVVFTCYSLSRLNDIEELLLKLKHQTYATYEIVIVIESSVKLLEKIQSFIKKNAMLNVKTVFTKEILGLSGARNLGVKEANGEYIAIIDDDAVPTTEWLEQAVNCLNISSTVIGATGPAIPLWKDKPLEWLPLELQWIIGATTWWDKKGICDVRHAWGMNLAFKREAFIKCYGFSENHGLKKGEEEGIKRFPHEDVEFSLRVRRTTRKRILYNPKMIVYHKVTSRKMNIKFFAKHAYVQGFAKRMVKEITNQYSDLPNCEKSLDREYDVLGRIFTVLVPSAIREMTEKPAMSMRKLLTTSVILFFLAAGYFSPFYFVVKANQEKA